MTRPGDIVLVDFPYADRPASKRRPALVIAERPDYEGDFLVAFVTSRRDLYEARWDVILDPSRPRDERTRLRTVSVVKTTKVTVVSLAALAGRLGVVAPSVMTTVRERLVEWLRETR